jgi:hypothetical protein
VSGCVSQKLNDEIPEVMVRNASMEEVDCRRVEIMCLKNDCS